MMSLEETINNTIAALACSRVDELTGSTDKLRSIIDKLREHNKQASKTADEVSLAVLLFEYIKLRESYAQSLELAVSRANQKKRDRIKMIQSELSTRERRSNDALKLLTDLIKN